MEFAKGMYWYYQGLFRDKLDARRKFMALMARYSEPHRRYHDIIHIADTLFEYLCYLRNEGSTDPAVIASIFYHDAVYTGTGLVDEKDSAALMLEDLSGVLSEDALLDAATQIINTASYTSGGSFGVMGDCDLAGLGKSINQYLENSKLIRMEYSKFSDEQFRQGRLKFLGAMLTLPRIFSTALFRTQYEATARRNMLMEFELLGGHHDR